MREVQVLFVGDDWAEAHHDVEVVDEEGRRLAGGRLPEGAAGLERLHSMIGDHLPEEAEPEDVIIGIETDRGPWVAALVASGYTVYAINPLQAARYRQRHSTSGAKSDPGDAHVLAEIVRLDRAHHRVIAGDSQLAGSVRQLARTHQTLIWTRQRQLNTLRSTLREFYPAALLAFGDRLSSPDMLEVLRIAPGPAQGAGLSRQRIASALRRGGRKRNVDARTEQIMTALRGEQLPVPAGLARAYAASVSALVAIITAASEQIDVLQGEVEASFGQHPDAEIYLSQPGMGPVLGARVLAEFGDDPSRYTDARARKNYSGMSPITRASGTRKVVLARYARNTRLGDALMLQAQTAARCSPGARDCYQRHRANGKSHNQALRALANRLVGILDHCLRTQVLYDEAKAWPTLCSAPEPAAA